MRADAARNRRQLLAAAADVFAERGLDASVSDIAKRAGVGKGTVFRHFPSKEDLLAAVVLDRIDGLAFEGERLLTAADPADGLLQFLSIAADRRQQRDLSFLSGAADVNAAVRRSREGLYRVIEALVDRARAAGVVRNDVTGTDVVLLMCAPNYVVGYLPDAPPELWRRYLAIIFDGLRPDGARPLPQPPPTI
jgi:AcrR family transcriptional regulator